MKNNPSHKVGLFVGVVCISLSFFLGYLYAAEQYNIKEKELLEKIHYIDVKVNSKNIEIVNSPKNIIFRVDGELIQSGSINLK